MSAVAAEGCQSKLYTIVAPPSEIERCASASIQYANSFDSLAEKVESPGAEQSHRPKEVLIM